MKHFTQPRNAMLRETHTPTPSEFPSPSPSSTAKKPRPSRRNRSTKENDPPSEHHNARFKTLLPPKPPSSNPLKRKLALDVPSLPTTYDSGVKVVVRMRPLRHDKEEVDSGVKQISKDSLFINGQNFTFDSVADTNSTQLDIFELVGVPLVENCLSGFNSSVFAYGQTGSGKTYTIWGPAYSLSEDNLTNDQRGLTPRVFERLFSRIDEEQTKHSDQQLKYQCRCSFIEIYNEQITDLLDPNQRNLHIREGVKSGVYVENLTEEPVCSMKDVTQLLMKGLSNRRVGATSINSESSRSHTVFTCVVESRCKSSADGISRFKTSRINLVDLAGSERQKLTGAAGDRLKEAGNINRSLSQLGNLINILAEVSQTGKQRHIPYRDSKLTFLLQDSLGGNAKLTMVCAISPAQSCRNETFSTLRFAQRAKAIKNKAVVNEVMHDDVNHLRKVIRQLRDELHQIKANGCSPSDGSGGHSTAWIQRSLNLLHSSLSRPPPIRHVDDDGDEVMEIVEDGVDDHLIALHNMDGGSAAMSAPNVSVDSPSPGASMNCESQSNPDVAQCNSPPKLKSPTPSVSPTITSSRKSLKTSLRLSPSNNILQGESELDKKIVDQKLCTDFSGQEAPNLLTKNENLAASIGLAVIGSQSSLQLSFKHRESKLIWPANKVDLGVQTSLDDNAREDSVEFDCNNCKSRVQHDVTEIDEGSNMQLVPVGFPESEDKPKKKILKAIEEVLAGSIRREMALEEFCAKQTSEIMLLNSLLQQYKHERECNAIIAETMEERILRLQSLIDGVLSAEEFKDEELVSLRHEHKLLKENYEHHPEVLEMKIELKRVQDELEEYQNFYKLGEKEVLMEEIQNLRNQLQFYVDSSATAEAERRWISLTEELRAELEANRSLAEKRKKELEAERKCVEELNQAMQMAIEGHARLLEQYADLEKQHVQLLERHRKIQDGIDHVKKPASRAGVRGLVSKFINSLAAEITALKAGKKKEIKILRDENRGLRAQLKDTKEAVQAAGELLVWLREAEEGVITAQKRAMDAEQIAVRAFKQVDKLKNKHEKEITTLQEQLAEARLSTKKARESTSNYFVMPPYDDRKEELHGVNDQFEQFCNEEDSSDLSKLAELSRFSSYDRCNI